MAKEPPNYAMLLLKVVLLIVKLLLSIYITPPKQLDDKQIILVKLELVISKSLSVIYIEKKDYSISNWASCVCLYYNY